MALTAFGSGFTQRAHADAQSGDFWNAVKILQDRGFSKYAILALLQGQGFELYGRADDGFSMDLLTDYGKKYGVQDASVMVYMMYEPNTGRPLLRNTLSELAKTVDKCLANNRPWRDCTLNYHPVDGCYLTKEQRRECKRVGNLWAKAQTTGDYSALTFPESEVCWNYPKGSGIMLPDSVVKSQLDLSKAKRKDMLVAANKVLRTVAAPRTDNFLGREVCESASTIGPAY